MVEVNLDALNRELEEATPVEILRWASEHFPAGIAASSSFQTQSVPLLHMIAQVLPAMPIYFVDTGFHFAETLQYRDRLAAELGLNVITLRPEGARFSSLAQHGELHRLDPDRCCFLNKVEPFEREKIKLAAWVAGIRRDQTEARGLVPILSVDHCGVYKICPLANWTERDVWRYIDRNDLRVHPLHVNGYRSIGCAPCTSPVDKEAGPRTGRWPGTEKTECGLHTLAPTPEAVREAGSR